MALPNLSWDARRHIMSRLDVKYARLSILIQLLRRVSGEAGESVAVTLHAVAPSVTHPAVQFLVVLGTVQRVQGLAAVLWAEISIIEGSL